MTLDELTKIESILNELRLLIRRRELAADGRITVRHPLTDDDVSLDVPKTELAKLNSRISELKKQLKDAVRSM